MRSGKRPRKQATGWIRAGKALALNRFGVWGMFALLLTSTFMAGSVTMMIFWIFGYAPKKKNRRICLPVAFSFLVLFILGAARHSPVPVLTELGCAMISGTAFFPGLDFPNNE